MSTANQYHPDRCGCQQPGVEKVSSAWLAQLREEYRLFGSECQRLRAENEQLAAQRDAILQQARAWACEAKTQQATVEEVGAILGGLPDWGPIAAGIEAMRAALTAQQAAEKAQEGKPFQARVLPWLLECFGEQIANDATERNHRFLEEALELVQACDCTADEAHKLVDYVFGRPAGERQQEVGGVMVTLAALCLARQLNMHLAGELELARITQPEMVARIREKQKRKPAMSPLPGIYPERQEMTS